MPRVIKPSFRSRSVVTGQLSQIEIDRMKTEPPKKLLTLGSRQLKRLKTQKIILPEVKFPPLQKNEDMVQYVAIHCNKVKTKDDVFDLFKELAREEIV